MTITSRITITITITMIIIMMILTIIITIVRVTRMIRLTSARRSFSSEMHPLQEAPEVYRSGHSTI